MSTLESLIANLHSLLPIMLELTRRWVEVNSWTENVPGVNEVGRLLAQAFRLPGLTLSMRAGGPDCGDHYFWATAASVEAPSIVIVGHHDTVFPPGSFTGWREEQGRVYGPGCLDMKGGLAVIWAVVKTLSDAGSLEQVPLIIASVADEETGSLNSRPHLEELARRAACALVFEAGRQNDAIITQRRGVGTLRVNATGRAAHAGNAHADGANAIWTMCRFIDAAQRLTDYPRNVTVNAGTIRGGTSANTVPAHCEARVDLRFGRTPDAEALIERLHAYATEVALPGTNLELAGGIKRLPMERTPESARLYQTYAQCQRDAGLGDGEHEPVSGGSDANTLSALGVPTIDGLGPRGSKFHTHHEYAEVASFGSKAEALLRFIWQHGRA